MRARAATEAPPGRPSLQAVPGGFAFQNQFRMCCKRFRTETGLGFAFANGLEGFAIIPAQTFRSRSPLSILFLLLCNQQPRHIQTATSRQNHSLRSTNNSPQPRSVPTYSRSYGGPDDPTDPHRSWGARNQLDAKNSLPPLAWLAGLRTIWYLCWAGRVGQAHIFNRKSEENTIVELHTRYYTIADPSSASGCLPTRFC